MIQISLTPKAKERLNSFITLLIQKRAYKGYVWYVKSSMDFKEEPLPKPDFLKMEFRKIWFFFQMYVWQKKGSSYLVVTWKHIFTVF